MEESYYYKNRERILNRIKESRVLKEKKTFNCIVCGKEKKSIYNIKFCSKECGNNYYKEKYRLAKEEGLIFSDSLFNSLLKLRWEILKRDNFRCQYCGRNPRDNKCILEIDHIKPKIKGGLTIKSNLITSCLECNHGKTDDLLDIHKLKILTKSEENIKNG